jgi:hypothetical protein
MWGLASFVSVVIERSCTTILERILPRFHSTVAPRNCLHHLLPGETRGETRGRSPRWGETRGRSPRLPGLSVHFDGLTAVLTRQRSASPIGIPGLPAFVRTTGGHCLGVEQPTAVAEVRLGHKEGGSCDPFTQEDAGRTPAAQPMAIPGFGSCGMSFGTARRIKRSINFLTAWL